MTTEEIAGKLTFFQEQIHMIHWETRSFAEHKATGKFYEYLQDFRDEVIEKMMGYTGKRIQSLKIELIGNKADALTVADQIMKFSKELEAFGDTKEFGDISNLAQALSGETAKLKYLLTLS
jgi:DNA-binding ferritin-like protein